VGEPPLNNLQEAAAASAPLGACRTDERWRRQLHTWEVVALRFNLDINRYDDFAYLCYMDIEDPYVQNYLRFQTDDETPWIVGRIRAHAEFWKTLNPPPWLFDLIEQGVKIPFEKKPPRIILPNNKSAVMPDMVPWVVGTLKEYLAYGFIEKVDEIPYCISPLQVKDTGGKTALIFDMSLLNEYIEKAKFKLEGWEEMFEYSKRSEWGIKFDLKKFYHEIDIHPAFQTYFGFMYKLSPNEPAQYFVWKTLPYGYTRAPYIAKMLMKPLVCKWRRLGAMAVVFYDDGMIVAKSREDLRVLSIEIQCDLLQAGLVPGVSKCIWSPAQQIDWNGLRFNFEKKIIGILPKRIEITLEHIDFLLTNWPTVSYRHVAKIVGQIGSMHPVFENLAYLRSRMLQTFVNIRHYRESDWNANIVSDYYPLFAAAYGELIFWKDWLVSHNERGFWAKKPTCIAWTDASDFAVGGFAVKLKADLPSQSILTADNWL